MLDRVLPIVVLLCSNISMTFSWYGNLDCNALPLLVIASSLGIAFFA